MNTALHEIESQSLPAHVSLCQERYRALENRMAGVEQRIDRVEGILLDIQSRLTQMAESESQRWLAAKSSVIVVLISALGFFLANSLSIL